MLVKRLVCIEDLGDIDVLVTDKTGTLTEGRISLSTPSTRPVRTPTRCCVRVCWPPMSTAASGGVSANALDAALWDAPTPRA